jgi:hypothetical protein
MPVHFPLPATNQLKKTASLVNLMGVKGMAGINRVVSLIYGTQPMKTFEGHCFSHALTSSQINGKLNGCAYLVA